MGRQAMMVGREQGSHPSLSVSIFRNCRNKGATTSPPSENPSPGGVNGVSGWVK